MGKNLEPTEQEDADCGGCSDGIDGWFYGSV